MADIPDERTREIAESNARGEEEGEEGRAWWRRKDYPADSKGLGVANGGIGANGVGGETAIVYEGLEEGLGAVAECIKGEGPFDGVVGFSQGACAAGFVASLLEGEARREAFIRQEKNGGIKYPDSFLAQDDKGDGRGRTGFVQAPLKFAVAYCGFRAPGDLYKPFYEPKIKTPLLNVLGAVDVVVDEGRSRALVDACKGGEERVVIHPGGHFVPSQKAWLDAVSGFVKECLVGREEREKEQEEKVEDMDVPF